MRSIPRGAPVIVVATLGIALSSCLWSGQSRASGTFTPERRYWPVSIEQVATTAHTHIQVTGRVKLVRREADGDLHIQLTGITGFCVAECLPALPCARPIVGSRITVWGISRRDFEHGAWGEVHPVERWEPVP